MVNALGVALGVHAAVALALARGWPRAAPAAPPPVHEIELAAAPQPAPSLPSLPSLAPMSEQRSGMRRRARPEQRSDPPKPEQRSDPAKCEQCSDPPKPEQCSDPAKCEQRSDLAAAGSGSGSGSGSGGSGGSSGSGSGAGSGTGPGLSSGSAAPVAAAVDLKALRDAAVARIRAQRRYPELARRRGVEGTVRLAFRVHADGSLAALAVRRGADPLLDDAALAAVRAAVPLPPLPGEIEIDLAFRLQDP
jgi:protein TonB